MIVLEFAVCGGIAFYLAGHWAQARKRNRASWDALVSRLKLDRNARLLCVPERSGDEQCGMLARGQRVWQARGLWAMYSNAGVLVELADYAARNGAPEERAAVDALRTEAVLIRLNLLACVGHFVLRAAEERAQSCMLCAEQAYAQLEVHVIERMERQAPEQLSALVAAS